MVAKAIKMFVFIFIVKKFSSSLLCLFLLLTVLSAIATGLECRLDTAVTVTLTVGDEGSVESANYPNEYPPEAAYCDVTLSLCTGCSLHLWQEEMKLSPCDVNMTHLIDDWHDVNSLHADDSIADVDSLRYCIKDNKCEYMAMYEAGYGPAVLDRRRSSDVRVFNSDVTIRFCYSTYSSDDDEVMLRRWKVQFYVTDNYDNRYSGASDDMVTARGIIYSLNYPYHCCLEPNMTLTYIVESRYATDCVMLTFDDLAFGSSDTIVKICGNQYDLDNCVVLDAGSMSEHKTFTGTHYLIVEFLSTNVSPLTPSYFKASYLFSDCSSGVPAKTEGCHQSMFRPLIGGRISVRSRDFDANSTVDCTWTLPPQHGINIVANIRILDFATDTGQTPSVWNLEIRKGHYSESQLINRITSADDLYHTTAEYSSTQGLHVRLRGNASSGLHLTFTYMYFTPLLLDSLTPTPANCQLNLTSHTIPGFPCRRDGKCIPANLTCDGTGHCGYWEDEELQTCNGALSQRVCPAQSYQCFGDLCVDGPEQCSSGYPLVLPLTAISVNWYHGVLLAVIIIVLSLLACLVTVSCTARRKKLAGSLNGSAYLSTAEREPTDFFIELHTLRDDVDLEGEGDGGSYSRGAWGQVSGPQRRLSPIPEQSPLPARTPTNGHCSNAAEQQQPNQHTASNHSNNSSNTNSTTTTNNNYNGGTLLRPSRINGNNVGTLVRQLFVMSRSMDSFDDDDINDALKVDEADHFDVEADVHSTAYLLEDLQR